MAQIQKAQQIETCSICLDRRLNARISPCQHKFCLKCINKWSKKQSSCPICRQQFSQILTSRRTILVKPIINVSGRPVRRNSNQYQFLNNMIFIPYPFMNLNYSWGYPNGLLFNPSIYFGSNNNQHMNQQGNQMFYYLNGQQNILNYQSNVVIN